ncbi:MAG: hypothetical protein ACI9DF_003334 [Verrucomicrobiales bacterium]|jgi:hypothetical protein
MNPSPAFRNAVSPLKQDRPISRAQLAQRWGVSKEIIKRRERDGMLSPIRFNQRLLQLELIMAGSVRREGDLLAGEPDNAFRNTGGSMDPAHSPAATAAEKKNG